MDIYVTYRGNPTNKGAEYQKRGRVWFKRKLNSDDPWARVESQYNKYLNTTFNVRMFNNIKPLYRFGIPIVGAFAAYYIYKKVLKG